MWAKLTQPSFSVVDQVQQRKSRLLASLQLVSILFAIILEAVAGGIAIFDPGRQPDFALTLAITPLAGIAIAITYWLNRRGCYERAGILSIGVWVMVIVVQAAFGPSISPIFFIVIPLAFGGMLLTTRQTIGLVVAAGLLHVVLWVLDPRALPVTDLEAFLYLALVGPIVVLVATYRDQFERERVSEAARGEEHFRWLAGAAFEGLAVTERGQVIDINDRLVEMLGYTREEMVDRPVMDFIAPESRALVREMQRIGYEQPYEHEMQRKDGSVVVVEAVGKAETYQGRQVRVTALRDMTARKRADRAREVVFNVSQAAIETSDLHQFLEIVHDELGTLTDVTNFFIALYNPETKLYSFPYWVDERDTDFSPQPLTGTLTEYVRLKGKPLLVDPRTRTRLLKEPDGDYYTPIGPMSQAWLGVPLKIEQRVIGVAAMQSYHQPDLYTEEDLDLLLRVSGDIALAIERKRTETALLDSERRFRTLVNSMDDIIFTLDEQQRHTGVYGRWLEKGGLSPEAFLGKTAIEFFGPDAGATHDEANKRALEGEQVVYEWSMDGPAGQQFYQTALSAILGEDGKPVGLVGVGRDITAIRAAEAARLESQAQYEALVNTIDGVVWETDPETASYRFVSKQAERMLGFPARRWLEEPQFWENHLHPDDRDRAIAHSEAEIRLGRDHTFEYRMIAADGRAVWVRDIVTVVAEAGQAIAVRGILIDITEQKQAEAALAESEEKFRLLSEQSLLGIAVIQDGQIRYANQAVSEINGYPVEEMLDWTQVDFARMIHPDDLDFAIEQARKKQAGDPNVVPHYAYRLITPDGKIKWVDQYSRTAMFEGQPADLITIIDITEQKEAEDQLRRQSAYLATLHETSLAVANRLEGATVLQSILEQATRLVGAEFGFLDLVNLDEDIIEVKLGTGKFGDFIGRRFRPGEGLAGKVWQRGEAILVEDYAIWDGRSRKYRAETHAALAAPLTSGGRVIGVIGAGFFDPDRKFNQDDLDMLGRFADLSSIVYENAQLFEAERDQRALAEAMQGIATALSQTLRLDEVLDLILESVTRMVDQDAANIMLVEGDRTRMVRVRGYEKLGLDRYVRSLEFPFTEFPLIKRIVTTGKTALINDTSRDPDYRVGHEIGWIRAFISAPIRQEGKVIGILSVDSGRPNRFTTSDARRLQALADHAAVAIRNAQLYEAERRQRALAEALQNIAIALNQTLRLDEVLDLILSHVEELVDHDAANIMFIEGEHTRIVRLRGYEAHGIALSAGKTYEIEALPLMKKLVSTGEPVLISDTDTEPLFVKHPDSPYIRSFAGVPIRREGKVVGILNVDSFIPGRLTIQDIGRLEPFADQAAVAIQNARLYEGERQQRAMAEALQAMATAINSSLRLDEVLDLVLDNVGRIITHDSSNIMLIDEGVIRIVRERGYADYGMGPYVGTLEMNPGEYPLIQRVIREDRPVIVSDTEAEPDYIKVPEGRIRSFVSVPIRLNERVIGILNADGITPYLFSSVDAERLQAFADHAAIAIGNARLYESERQQRALAEALRAIAAAINQTLDQDRVLDLILDSLHLLVSFDAANIALIDEEYSMIVRGQGYGEQDVSRIQNRIADHPHLKRLVEFGTPILIANTETDPEWVKLPDGTSWLRAMLSVPIRIEDRVIGRISVDSRTPHRFSEQDVARLQAFAEHAAVALQNARLYQQVQAHAAEMEERVAARTAELRAANAQLLALSQIKDEFVSNVSHELRTPITSIKLHQHMLSLRATPQQQTNVDVLRRETLRLEGLVEGLLLLSRFDQDQAAVEMALIDLNQVAADLIEDRKALAAERQLELELKTQPDLPQIKGDASLIGQALSIFVTNALNYTPSGGRVTVATAKNGRKRAGFIISDTGPGIPLDEQEKLFSRFFRGKVGHESRVSGTGLGLAIAREIIDRHNGQIEIESAGIPGEGATFRVWLPIG